MNKRRLVVANWKQYVQSPEEAKKFVSTLRKRSKNFTGVDAWIAPSFTLLPPVAASLKGSVFKLGAQSVSPFEEGAHTGEISAAMIKQAGAQFCIVGHSERRALGESNDMVRLELAAVSRAGLSALVCVGELERDASGSHFAYIEEQVRSALAGMVPFAKKITVAYEPVWAIGKSAQDAMKPAELRETVIFIKKILADVLGRDTALKLPILYGGSVEPDNAHQLIEEGDVSGFLVGHASANIDSFIEILKALRRSQGK